MQVRSLLDSSASRRDLGRDEDVEDVAFFFPDDRPFSIDVRPGVAVTFEDVELFMSCSPHRACRANDFVNSTRIYNGLQNFLVLLSVQLHL